MLSSDASLYNYGTLVEQDRNRYEISDFWEENDQRLTHLKEADAVYKVLLVLGENLDDQCTQRRELLGTRRLYDYSDSDIPSVGGPVRVHSEPKRHVACGEVCGERNQQSGERT